MLCQLFVIKIHKCIDIHLNKLLNQKKMGSDTRTHTYTSPCVHDLITNDACKKQES